ncbi:MAG: pyridoxal-dependent decarboxylase [Gammaproteobacteria bacterium]|nr:pyridoxal-dependent decarboxylase [Gammaproteobacteria bacterium]MYH91580.1 aspartate aminotransferase family protein [Gammaproteobacteria bacterium]
MNPEAFRKEAHELIDWICDYRQRIEDMPVRTRVGPGDIRGALPATPPEEPEPFADVMRDLESIVVPGITQVQHPMHFGWFPSNASLASVLGDFASSGLGTLGISWESCPALTEVEEVVCDWMRQLVGLSDSWKGTIHDTASTACLTAMILAREKATDYGETRGGLQQADNPLVVYTTEEAHSSVRKAALLAGFGADNIRNVPMDPHTRAMRPEALVALIEQDQAAGAVPAMAVASVGSTGITAMDPVEAMADCARRYGIWLHVDAAMAGSAMLLPECRHLWQGVEGADSVSWNPHKWMGTILDCSLFYVRDPGHLVRVMSTNPSYLRSGVDGEVTQYRDWGIPLGRRFRALKLWFHLRLDGIGAIRRRLRDDLENARWLAEQVEAEPRWTLEAPVTLQTVCVLHRPPGLDGEALDAHTLAWVDAINRSGAAFLSPAKIGGRWIVRVSVGVEATERHHVEALWNLVRETAAGIPA